MYTHYLKYKKEHFDITKIPPAEGQIREIQLANLALLEELDYVCKKNNLKYWLDFGTLLGAIRHNGYIPWDDDVDTGMIRADYEKIIEAFKNDSRNPDIYADYYLDEKYNCFIKILHKKCKHLFVDIFPYDNCPDLTPNKQIELTKNLKIYRKKNIDKITCKNEIIKKIQEGKQLYIDNPSNDKPHYIYGFDYNHTYKNWFYHNEILFPLKEKQFEGLSLPIVNRAEEYLTRTFNNFMEYPKKFGMGHAMYLDLSEDEKDIIKNLINHRIT